MGNTGREEKTVKNENSNQTILDEESILKKVPARLQTPFKGHSEEKNNPTISMKSQIQQHFFKQDE